MADSCLRRSRLQSGSAQAYHRRMKVHLSHPERHVEVKGPKRVKDLLRDLNLLVEAHLVIRGDELVTEDELLRDEDYVEIRPVISGGSADEESRVRGSRGAVETSYRSLLPRTSHLVPRTNFLP